MKTFLIVLGVTAAWIAAQQWLLPKCEEGCDTCLNVTLPDAK